MDAVLFGDALVRERFLAALGVFDPEVAPVLLALGGLFGGRAVRRFVAACGAAPNFFSSQRRRIATFAERIVAVVSASAERSPGVLAGANESTAFESLVL